MDLPAGIDDRLEHSAHLALGEDPLARLFDIARPRTRSERARESAAQHRRVARIGRRRALLGCGQRTAPEQFELAAEASRQPNRDCGGDAARAAGHEDHRVRAELERGLSGAGERFGHEREAMAHARCVADLDRAGQRGSS